MTRFVLVIGAGLLSAHAAYAKNLHCSTQCPASGVSNLVCYLIASYNPSTTNSPGCDTSRTVPQATVTLINNAYSAAPAGLKACLCSLTHIYVTDDATYGSWGKWENPRRSGQYRRVKGNDNSSIALYTSDLNTTVPQQQDAHLATLQIAAGVATDTEVNHSNIDSSTLAVLYALAHEMAHMSWKRDNGLYGTGCQLKDMAKSWLDPQNAPTWATRLWTTFGDTRFGQRNQSVLPNPWNASAGDLQTIYTGGVVTALGAANPEEDFVESYAVETINLATKTNVTPTNFTLNINLTIGGNTVTLPVNTNRNSDVQYKFGCVETF
jgi:hypothetical protein